jgi:hypothetical protein
MCYNNKYRDLVLITNMISIIISQSKLMKSS